jgi:predicted amidohydrolase YtcJ
VPGTARSEPAAPSLLLENARVLTQDPDRPRAEAVWTADGVVRAVGSAEEVRRAADASGGADRIDLGGALLIPGFEDAHLHLLGGGLSLIRVDLNGVASLDEAGRRVAAAAAARPEGAWIRGRGWDHTLLSGGDWPPRDVLDRAAPRHPVFLDRTDGHVAWLNAEALARLGIDAGTRAPDGGGIVLRTAAREPTGILLESAKEEAASRIPPATRAERREGLEAALALAARSGVTGVHDHSPEGWDLYRDLHDAGELTLRIHWWNDLTEEAVEAGPDHASRRPPAASGAGSPLLTAGPLKSFTDGTLGSRTAALLADYADDPGNSGLFVVEREAYADLLARAHAAGFQLAVHAIGDGANRFALDVFTGLAARPDGRGPRHRIEHVQVLDPADRPRFRAAGVVASVQPCHLLSDRRWVEARVGPGRAAGAYAWRSLSEAGARLALGTDWPIEPLDPLRNLCAAVTRRAPEDAADVLPWRPEESLAVEDALAAYTLGPAWAAFAENVRGRIRPGFDADLVAVDRNVIEEPDTLREARVVLTVSAGRVVHREEKT